MKEYYQKSWTRVVELLGSNVYNGLMEYDCIVRREQYGDNKVIIPNRKNIGRSLLEKLFSLSSFIYLFVIILFIVSKQYIFLLIELIAFSLSIIHTWWYSLKNKKNIEMLGNLNTSDVTVLREGVERIVSAEDLVIGDIVLFKENSFISADLRIISAENLKVNERNITGDKVLKDKYEAMLDNNVASLSDISNILFRGSIIKSGSGTGIVIATGMNTHLGKLLSALDRYDLKKNLGFKEIDEIISKINIIGILISVILFFVVPGKVYIKKEILLDCLFISTAFIYPLIYYIYDKIISKELEKDNIYVNNIFTLKDSDIVKVIFVEKFGSITEDTAEVEKIFYNETSFLAKDLDKGNSDLLRMIGICCTTSNIYHETKDEDDIFGEAYIRFCEKYDFDKDKIARENRFKFRTEVNSTNSIKTTVTKNSRGFRATSRGSLDKILSKCTNILINGVEYPLTEEEINKIKLADLCFSREGLITEAMAYRRFNYEPSKEENIESNMVLVGLFGLKNSIVEDVKEDIESLFDDGILPLLFCEDNKISAEILGRNIGLISSSKEVTSGVELSHMSEEEFYKTVSKARIFCRLKPDQKLKIVNAFYNDGFKVAVEGETLGDLSLISMSNIGIGKAKASKILKHICDIYTEKSSIKALLHLKRKDKEVRKSIEYANSIYMQFILSQIFMMYAYYFIDDKILFKNSSIISLNLLLIPMVLLALNNLSINNIENKHSLLNAVIYNVVTIVAILAMKENIEIVVFLIMCINFLTYLYRNQFKNIYEYKNIIYTALYIIIVIIGTIFLYKKEVLINIFTISIILISFLVYVTMIWFSKKWQ